MVMYWAGIGMVSIVSPGFRVSCGHGAWATADPVESSAHRNSVSVLDCMTLPP